MVYAVTVELPTVVQPFANDVTRCTDKYVLVEEFRGGASGSVWKAWDRELGRWAVLKFPAAHAASELERLQREAHLAAKLSHPNIARIYDVRLERGNAYIVMEFIDGEALDRAPLRLADALAAVRDAALAIQYAHEQGVIHRDLKPANLMHENGGRLVVLDFGIARSIAGPKEFTATGGVLGTPAYMSPEQVQGRVSPRSDIYSLGATLYRLVAGRLAFEGEDVLDVLLRIARVDFPPPRSVNPKLHPDVEAVIMRAMEHSPERRYGTAREMAEDLSRLIAVEPVLAPRFTRFRRMRRVVARHRALSVLTALVVVVALAGGIAATVITFRKNRELAAERLRSVEEEARRLREQVRAQPVLDDARTELEQADRMLYAQEFEAARYRETLRHVRDFARDAIAIKGDFAEAYFVLGSALQYLGDGAAADAAFAKAAELAPTYLEARFARGFLHLQRYLDGRRPSLRYGPGSMAVDAAPAETTELRAEREIFRGEFEAVMFYSHRPEPALFAHATLAMADQDFATARRAFAEFLALRPHDADALYLAGMCDLYVGEVTGGTKRLEAAAKLRPWHMPTLMNLGICRMAAGRADDAIVLYDKVVSAAPENGWVFNSRGTAHAMIAMREGRDSEHWEACFRDFAEALRLEPASVNAHMHRAMAYALYGRMDESLVDIDAAIAIAGPTASLLWLRGSTLTRLARWQEAMADLDGVLKEQPNNEDALAGRGICRLRLNQPREALADFERCVQLVPAMKKQVQPYVDEARRKLDQ